ncbi:phage virion morphogenesis protein [Roseobacteraceae bacterium NS-SX3]
MSGAYVKFSLEDRQLQRDLQEGLARLENPEPFLRSIGEEMLPRIGSRFKEEKGPDSARWEPLAAATVQARLKRYGNSPLTILRMRGHLAGSLNYQAAGSILRIGTGKEAEHYAGIHQFGGQAGRGLKVHIPARPYLGFSDEDMDVIAEEAADYLANI